MLFLLFTGLQPTLISVLRLSVIIALAVLLTIYADVPSFVARLTLACISELPRACSLGNVSPSVWRSRLTYPVLVTWCRLAHAIVIWGL